MLDKPQPAGLGLVITDETGELVLWLFSWRILIMPDTHMDSLNMVPQISLQHLLTTMLTA
jgi:hypothetical protein